MKYYLKSIDEACKEVNSDSHGLSSEEAEQRLEENGRNKLAESKKDSIVRRFLTQLADPMIIILIAAAAISGVTSYYSGESFADVIIILAVVIIKVTALAVLYRNGSIRANGRAK